MSAPHAVDGDAIGRQWIESHIPHQGSMCLLDHVARWDADEIFCIARNHRDANNPLRRDGSLGIATAIEYAAQAVAVHSALLLDNGATLGSGFLTSARNVQWRHARLDNLNDDLTVQASRLSGDALTVLYAFALLAGTEKIIEGRISIFLNGEAAEKFGAFPS